MDTEKVLFSLLRAEVCGGTVEENVRDSLSAEMLSSLYTLSKKHDLAHIVGHTLYKLGALREDEVSQKLKQASMQAVYRYARMEHEFVCICKTLEEAKIPYIPLKGAVIRAYYPEPWMRTSCDIDILVKQENLDTAILALTDKLGYRKGERFSYDVSLYSASGVHLELHFHVQERKGKTLLENIWSDAKPLDGAMCRHDMSDAMFYYYHIFHMTKHIEDGGCGIKPFLDLWILNHKVEHDRQKRERLLAENGLLTFAKAAEKLSEVWFSDAKADALSMQLETFTLEGGVYGSLKNSMAVKQAQKGGILQFAIYKIFLPYDVIKYHYPVLQKHKWLLPFCQVRRWLRLARCGRIGNYARAVKNNVAMENDERAYTTDLLEKLGL